MVEIVAQPLTPESYAPYGEVIMAARGGASGRPANMGTARRFDRLAEVVDLRGGHAPLNLCVFRCEPRREFPLEVTLLEKHAESTQVFLPMNARRFLVVVAQGGERPDLSTLAAFVAPGAQGISYRPGVWHHPMIALDDTSDFACLVHEDGTDSDCAVVEYAPGQRPRVALR